MFCVIETARGWRIGNSIFHDSEPHERVFYFSCIVHAEYVSRKDRGNGNGPRLRRKPPTQYSSALRFSTRFRINFCSIPNIYKEFYWNVSRLSTYPRQPSYPPSSSTLFVFSCWCAILPPVPRALCQSSFHFD